METTSGWKPGSRRLPHCGKPHPAYLPRLSAALGKRSLPPHAPAFPTVTAPLRPRGRQPIENTRERADSRPIPVVDHSFDFPFLIHSKAGSARIKNEELRMKN